MPETDVDNRPAIGEEITLTKKAAVRVSKVKSENNIPAGHGLRLSVKGGG